MNKEFPKQLDTNKLIDVLIYFSEQEEGILCQESGQKNTNTFYN